MSCIDIWIGAVLDRKEFWTLDVAGGVAIGAPFLLAAGEHVGEMLDRVHSGRQGGLMSSLSASIVVPVPVATG